MGQGAWLMLSIDTERGFDWSSSEGARSSAEMMSTYLIYRMGGLLSAEMR